MQTIETTDNIKLDIQTDGVQMNDYLQGRVNNMIKRLRNKIPNISTLDIHLKANEDPARPRTVLVRFAVPGKELVATDTGERWKILLRNIEKRLVIEEARKKVSWQSEMELA